MPVVQTAHKTSRNNRAGRKYPDYNAFWGALIFGQIPLPQFIVVETT